VLALIGALASATASGAATISPTASKSGSHKLARALGRSVGITVEFLPANARPDNAGPRLPPNPSKTIYATQVNFYGGFAHRKVGA
jgi:hypothetical protein